MFNLFKKEKPRQPIEIRDTLFGDMTISEWPRDANAKLGTLDLIRQSPEIS